MTTYDSSLTVRNAAQAISRGGNIRCYLNGRTFLTSSASMVLSTLLRGGTAWETS